MKKSYFLNEKRPNKFKSKKHIPPRGKRKLSSKEKRKLGLNKLDKKNKTFEMFLPLNEMWKTYAETLLDVDKLLKSNWKCEASDSKTENLQMKLKKIDYTGCFIRVTKSKCSNYIGLIGIVMKETKSTFCIITPKNEVKIISKIHSEFSFVVSGIGFSVLGNHLCQRPVDRSKHGFKKHCLWL